MKGDERVTIEQLLDLELGMQRVFGEILPIMIGANVLSSCIAHVTSDNVVAFAETLKREQAEWLDDVYSLTKKARNDSVALAVRRAARILDGGEA